MKHSSKMNGRQSELFCESVGHEHLLRAFEIGGIVVNFFCLELVANDDVDNEKVVKEAHDTVTVHAIDEASVAGKSVRKVLDAHSALET